LRICEVTVFRTGHVTRGSKGAGCLRYFEISSWEEGKLGLILARHEALGHVTFGHVTFGHVTFGHVTFGHVTFGHVI